MVENLYSHEILAENAILGDFEPYFYCACAETVIILLPVSNLTTPFDPACPKTYMFKKFWLKTRFCRYFSRMSIFCPILCIGDFLRMRVKPEVVVRFCCPTKLVLTILVPNHRAKFGDDRLRIADARVVTDGHTHPHPYVFGHAGLNGVVRFDVGSSNVAMYFGMRSENMAHNPMKVVF